MGQKEASRSGCCCSTPRSTARTLDAWEDLKGWTDPREFLPPPGCLVDLVMDDCREAVRGRRMILRNGLDYWKLESDESAYQLFEDVLAWDWVLPGDENEHNA